MNAAGLTLIVVTHDPAVARRARRVLVLHDGRVVHRGKGADIHAAVEILSAAENGGSAPGTSWASPRTRCAATACAPP